MAFRLDPPGEGPGLMAADEKLLASAEDGRGGVRVYTWARPWVTLGQSQSAERALLPGCPVPWVKRPTGGRGVLHGHDITLGAALPLRALGFGPEDSRSAIQVYRAVIRPIAAALAACGVPACLGEDLAALPPGEGPDDCFAHVAPNDVVDPSTGRKLMGCSLRLTLEAVLVQASLPVSPPLVAPSLVFASPAPSGSSLSLSPQSLLEALEAELGPILASE